MTAPETTDTITLTRALTRDQRARRERLVRAAADLALEGGYAAVTMHDVADRAGVARATVYRYFTSKNHLLSEVSAIWLGRLLDGLAGQRLPEDPVERLATLMCRIVVDSTENRLLAEAVVRAATAPDPSARQAQEIHRSMGRVTALAFGDPAPRRSGDEAGTAAGPVPEDAHGNGPGSGSDGGSEDGPGGVPDSGKTAGAPAPARPPMSPTRRAEIEDVLGHVLLSGLISLTARGRSSEDVQELMRTAVRLMM